MALKAIGDIGNAEAKEFLNQALTELDTKIEKEEQWNKEIIQFYLD